MRGETQGQAPRKPFRCAGEKASGVRGEGCLWWVSDPQVWARQEVPKANVKDSRGP